MPQIHKNLKLVLIILVIALLGYGIYRQSVKLYRGVHSVQLPSQQSRQVSDFGVYNWITVPELARRHSISEERIFELLEIVPSTEDYALSLKELKSKYNKSPEEMRKAIRSILDSSRKKDKPPGAEPTNERPPSSESPGSKPPNGESHE